MNLLKFADDDDDVTCDVQNDEDQQYHHRLCMQSRVCTPRQTLNSKVASCMPTNAK